MSLCVRTIFRRLHGVRLESFFDGSQRVGAASALGCQVSAGIAESKLVAKLGSACQVLMLVECY